MKELVNFLDGAHTKFHAVALLCQQLNEAGFKKLNEGKPWQLERGGKYYVTRNSSSVIAFRVSSDAEPGSQGFFIAAAHTDSPTFEVRICSTAGDEVGGPLPVDEYGGAIVSSWYDRPLAIAGRSVDFALPQNPKEHLLDSVVPVAIFPSPAPHLHAEPPQQPLAVLIDTSYHAVLKKLFEPTPISYRSTTSSTELYLYDPAPVIAMGENGRILQGPHMDNLVSCFAAITGLIKSRENPQHQVVACFDLEEVGSLNYAGARSNFLNAVLDRIAATFATDATTPLQMRANSWILSLDAAHAANPPTEKCFVPRYTPKLSVGTALKFDTCVHYATDCVGCAFVDSLACMADLPYQYFIPVNSKRCGSTIGPSLAAATGIRTIDMGIPVWSMHALREIISITDVKNMSRFLRFFWQEGHTLPNCN